MITDHLNFLIASSFQVACYRESWPKISLSYSRANWALMSRAGNEPQTPCIIGRYSRKEPSRPLILFNIRSTIYAGKSPHCFGDFLPRNNVQYVQADWRGKNQIRRQQTIVCMFQYIGFLKVFSLRASLFLFCFRRGDPCGALPWYTYKIINKWNCKRLSSLINFFRPFKPNIFSWLPGLCLLLAA